MASEKIYNGIKIKVAKNYEEMSMLAAEIIIERIHSRPKIPLLLPAGLTPSGVYKILSKQNPEIFKNITFFNMDEYCVLEANKIQMIDETDLRSFRYFMKIHLFNYIGRVNSHFPTIENVAQEGFYDEIIKSYGGIDLCVNAMGEDGHTFGFNFPGSSFSSRTRLVKINQETRDVNKRLTGFETPEFAITIGIQTGMESKEVLFLVSGKRKSGILRKVIYGSISEEVPATILRNHRNCHWIIDEDAENELKDYI